MLNQSEKVLNFVAQCQNQQPGSNMKIFLLTIFASFICCISHAQIQTITFGSGATNVNNNTWLGGVITVPTNGIATLKSVIGGGGDGNFIINCQGTNINYYFSSFPSLPLVVVGPATIQIQGEWIGPPRHRPAFRP